MKTKNIVVSLMCILTLVFFILPTSSAQSAENVCGYSVAGGYILMLNEAISTILTMFLALFVWFISPVGILFFAAAKILFSEPSSSWKKKVAWILQGISFLIWASFMSILLIIYFDSVWHNILNLDGDIFSFAISSGIGFALAMLFVVYLEKRMGKNAARPNENKKNTTEENASSDKNNDCGEEDNIEKEKREQKYKKENKIKIANIEFGGVKEKVRKKIKENLKEIIDNEIDRRL